MFTTGQIKAAHSRMKSGADFPYYIRDIKKLGVTSYEVFVTDGHTDYYGAGNPDLLRFMQLQSLSIPC